MKPGLLIKAFRRLEPYDAKVSRTVLRGRRRRQLLLCYPTLKPALLLTLGLIILLQNVCFAKSHLTSCGSGKICRPQKEIFSGVISAKYPKLLVFVSFAMPMATLTELTNQVNALGGAVVFRGLVEGSFRKTAVKLKELGCESMIDPTLFEAYKVTAAPTFILRQENTASAEQPIPSDRITGNVSLHYVLEEFASKGDTAEEAKALLQKLKEGS